MKKIFNLIGFVFLLNYSLYGFNPNNIVVFGDSLSDIGNIDRYTNGLIWLEVLAEKCQLLSLECSKLGGSNFAYGGAKSGENEDKTILDVGNQIGAYLELYEGKANPQTLYVIWVGGNDFLAKRNPLQLIANIRNHIEVLASAGAQKFLVPNLPSLTYAPRGKELAQSIVYNLLNYLPKSFELPLRTIVNRVLYVVMNLYNLKLELMLKQMENKKSIHVYYLDTFELFNKIFKNLEEFGFKEKTELFYDALHPSAQAHAIIGAAAHRMIVEK